MMRAGGKDIVAWVADDESRRQQCHTRVTSNDFKQQERVGDNNSRQQKKRYGGRRGKWSLMVEQGKNNTKKEV